MGLGLVAALAPTVTADATPTVTLWSAKPTVLVGEIATVTGVADGDAGNPAAIEALTGSGWSTSRVGTTTTGGRFTLPITYGSTTAGTYTFRLRASVGGSVGYSRQFTIERLPTSVVLLSAPNTAPAGTTASARARVQNVGAGQIVSTQFLVNGSWSTSQSRTTSSAGEVTIPLTYGQHSAGSYSWRLTSTNRYGITSATRAYTLTRTPASAGPVIPDSQYNTRRGPNVTNRVVLTYDDCPTSLAAFKNTVLAAEAADVGLALFPTGDCIRSGRFDAAFARAHGMHVFNHSVSHPDLTTLSYAGVRTQLGAPGVVTTYGRPPYGAVNATVRSAYASVGMRIWLWDVDTNDWRGKSQSQVVGYVVANARGGNSVLMHMQWNGFNASAIRSMKSGLSAKGIGLCRNYVGTVPVKPTGMWC